MLALRAYFFFLAAAAPFLALRFLHFFAVPSTPSPLSCAVGPPAFRAPVRCPLEFGEKLTLIVQLAPARLPMRIGGQLLSWTKSPVTEIETGKVSGTQGSEPTAHPTNRLKGCAVPVVLTAWEPKS